MKKRGKKQGSVMKNKVTTMKNDETQKKTMKNDEKARKPPMKHDEKEKKKQ